MMKKIFVLLIGFVLITINSCQTVPECQKHSTSELTINNEVGLIIEVAVQRREPHGDHNYGFRIIKPNSSTTYKRVNEGNITLWVRLDGTNRWQHHDTYNAKCHDHDFVWGWEYNTNTLNIINEEEN